VTGFLAAAVLASRPVWRVLGRLRPGYAARIDREVRDIAGMARQHPESLTRTLRRREERCLTALCGQLWPGKEYEAEL
jgi:hypothetical protein